MKQLSRFPQSLVALSVALCLLWTQRALAQGADQYQQTRLVSLQEPVTLDVDIESGQLQVLYSRDGQVSISVSMPGLQASNDPTTPPLVEQTGNHITIRGPRLGDEQKNKTPHYRLDVPYRTEIVSRVGTGKQEIIGIMGPVRAVTESGDTRVSYVSQDVAATVENGNLEFDVIGGRIQARVHRGNISCTRAAQGIDAQSEQGDITLTAVGPSSATVKEGFGRIEVSGARAAFVGSTNGGDIHVKAVVHDDWQMKSKSGSIRIELPANSGFQLDASTETGELRLDRDDLEKADAGSHHIHQTVNAGGKRIDVHTETGQIAIR